MILKNDFEKLFQVSSTMIEAFQKINKIIEDYISIRQVQQQREDTQVFHINNKSESIDKFKSLTANNEEKKKQLQFKVNQRYYHPQKPRPPLKPFIRFGNINIQKIHKEYPYLNNNEVMNILKTLWNDISQAERQPFKKEFRREKARYKRELEKFYIKYPQQIPLHQRLQRPRQ